MDPSLEARWCAVTGGRGFLARHLVMALLRSGRWRVRITDLRRDPALEPTERDGILGDALRDGRAVYHSADVCNLSQLTQALEGVDTVFHTAAADPTDNDYRIHYNVNVHGTKNVIQACTTCKVKALIYTSSSAVVFDGVHGLFDVDESTPYPHKTKAEAEKLVRMANGADHLVTCCLRPGNIFGPGDKIFPILPFYGGIMIIVGDGNNWDDSVYVENVVHALVCAEKTISTKEGASRIGGQAYFITNMEPMNMWDFLRMVLKDLGYKSRFTLRIPLILLMPITRLLDWSYDKLLSRYGMQKPGVMSSAYIKYATLNRTFNCNNAVEQLGYKPIVSLKEGVKMTTEFYKQAKT